MMKSFISAAFISVLSLSGAIAQEISKSAVFDCMYQMGDGWVLLFSAEEIGIEPSPEVLERFENAIEMLLQIQPERVHPPLTEQDALTIEQATTKAVPMKKALFDGALMGAPSKVYLVDALLGDITDNVLACVE